MNRIWIFLNNSAIVAGYLIPPKIIPSVSKDILDAADTTFILDKVKPVNLTLEPKQMKLKDYDTCHVCYCTDRDGFGILL